MEAGAPDATCAATSCSKRRNASCTFGMCKGCCESHGMHCSSHSAARAPAVPGRRATQAVGAPLQRLQGLGQGQQGQGQQVPLMQPLQIPVLQPHQLQQLQQHQLQVQLLAAQQQQMLRQGLPMQLQLPLGQPLQLPLGQPLQLPLGLQLGQSLGQPLQLQPGQPRQPPLGHLHQHQHQHQEVREVQHGGDANTADATIDDLGMSVDDAYEELGNLLAYK